VATATKITVIVPFYNAAATIAPCLESLLANDYENFEVIAVDDRSTDDSPAIAARYDITLLQMIRRSGAAAARNLAAAAATGDIFYFADADVLAPPNMLSRLAEIFAAEPELDACFGAYTTLPAASNFTSVYKNLIHHYTHLTSRKHAATFWCGCGAIRRHVFERANGFNEDYVASSVEDIDLGYRLTKLGANIQLRSDLRVTHAKRYTLWTLIRSDLFDRAIPWTRLMAAQNIFRADLNLKAVNIISGFLLALLLPLAVAALFVLPREYAQWLVAAVALGYVVLNARICWFVLRVKGLWFALAFFVMYIITYIYSVVGFVLGLAQFVWEQARKKKGP
jgi:glycosyltransferase involved in cell wall biosynthesis